MRVGEVPLGGGARGAGRKFAVRNRPLTAAGEILPRQSAHAPADHGKKRTHLSTPTHAHQAVASRTEGAT